MINPDPTARTARIANLEAEAPYARERFDHYKQSSESTRPSQLRKLQEACRYAEARLERAQKETP